MAPRALTDREAAGREAAGREARRAPGAREQLARVEGFLDALANLPRPSYRPRRDARGVRFAGPGLRRTERLLELVGSPERGMRVVHVAGTSGKGSVTLMLAEALRAAGRRVGAFFSPHLTSFVERFWAGGRLVVPGPEVFSAFCEACRRMALEPAGTPSYFEGTLALALLTFRERGCEDVLLEAGLGGSYDATAAVRPAALDVLTSVGLDHTDVLGDTAREIARDKAGIITEGGEVLLGWAPREAEAEVRRAARERGARLRARPALSLGGVSLGGTRLGVAFGDGTRWEDLYTPLIGEHQAKNAALAAAGARLLGVGEAPFREGLARARLPGRVEVLEGEPPVLLDGAHNRDKARALRESLRALGISGYQLVVGMLQDKDVESLAEILVPEAEETWVALPPGDAPRPACPPERLLRAVRRAGGAARLALDPGEALEGAREQARRGGWVVVAGSLYLAGWIRRRWVSPETIVAAGSCFPG